MLIRTIVVTPFQQNARVILNDAQTAAVVIDPGGELDRILEIGLPRGCKIEGVVLTHSHIDHLGAAQELLDRYCADKGKNLCLYAHRAEMQFRQGVSMQAEYFGLSASEYRNLREPEYYLEDEAELNFSFFDARVYFTPGHSPGHIVLYIEACPWDIEVYDGSVTRCSKDSGESPLLIAGDTLFAGSIGRTDLPGGDYQTLIASLKNKILTLPEHTRVLSGHGPDTLIGKEKKSNPFILEV